MLLFSISVLTSCLTIRSIAVTLVSSSHTSPDYAVTARTLSFRFLRPVGPPYPVIAEASCCLHTPSNTTACAVMSGPLVSVHCYYVFVVCCVQLRRLVRLRIEWISALTKIVFHCFVFIVLVRLCTYLTHIAVQRVHVRIGWHMFACMLFLQGCTTCWMGRLNPPPVLRH